MEPGEQADETALRETLKRLLYVAITTFWRARRHFLVRSTQKDLQALIFCALRVVFRHIVTGELRHEINGSSDTARWYPSLS